MKTFQSFAQLAAAKVVTGTPVRVLSPTLIEGQINASGQGLALPSGNVFVPRLDDIEILTGRKNTLLDDAFPNNLSATVGRYHKRSDGTWELSSTGRTSSIYYNGHIWLPITEVNYTAAGYRASSWTAPTGSSDILEVRLNTGTVLQFRKFTGAPLRNLVVNVLDFGAQGTGVGSDEASFVAALGATTGPVLIPYTENSYVLDGGHNFATGAQRFYSYGIIAFSGSNANRPTVNNLLA